MGVTLRPWVDRIAGNHAAVPWVRAQVVCQAVRNVGQIGQGQRVSRVVAGNGYFQGIETA